MIKNKNTLSMEESELLTKVMTMGAGTTLPVVMTPSEFVKLIGVIYHDNGAGHALETEHLGLWEKINPCADYYDVNEIWFREEIPLVPQEHIALIRTGKKQIADFSTYLRCLAELHKRRRKYAMILQNQPFPSMEQISPRSLIEYGGIHSKALMSWLTWRKFFYDLDNRAAQETGYLFEPILAAAIGGEQKSAKARVVFRTDDPTRGRQVDCWKVLPDGQKLAYEFKLRVTIAASGQGRFKEETQFAEDAFNSGVVPVLLVLDSTMNARLDDLQKSYTSKGGRVYLGKDAWSHLECEAGDIMSRFINKYVRLPIEEMDNLDRVDDGLLDFYASHDDGFLKINIGNHEKLIERNNKFHRLGREDCLDNSEF